MSVNMRNKVPETCRYWRMNKCIKGKHQCNYVHGFICVNDGRCWRENCSNWHFRQKRGGRGDHYGKSHQNYQKMHRNRHPRSRSRSMSPRWHHKGGHRMRSPPRRRSRSRSPPSWRSRSRSPPPRRSRSRSSHPRRSRSRSPPPRRSRSHSYPSRRSRSRSYSFPSRRSKSRTPASHRSRSRSSPRETRSPCPSHQRSRSHSPFEHRSRSRSRRISQSPSRRSRSASVSHNKSRSRSPANQRSGSFNSGERKSRSPSLPRQRNRSGTMSSFDSENYNANQEQRDGFERSQHTGNIRSNNNSYSSSPLSNCPPMHKNRSGTQEQVSRQEAMRPDVPISEQMKIAPDQDQKERTSIVELQERIARDLMDPHTQNLLKELLKQSKKTVEEKESPRKDISPDPAIVASELEELGMDLEEVGEEVDDIFGKSISRSVEDSIGNSFQEGLERGKRLRQVQASANPSPPSRERGHEPKPSSRGQETRYPSDWNLKSTMEDPRKHLHSSLQSSEEPTVKGVPDDAKSSGSSFWVPAFDWHKAQKVKKDMSYQSGANDWEVETPYVQRKEKMGERQAAHPTLKETKQMVPPTAISSSSSSSSRLPPVPAMTSQLDEEATASRITELNKDKVPQSRPMLFPSGHSYSPSVPPPSSQTRAHSSRSAIPSPGDEAADDHEPPVQVRSKSKRQKTGKSKQRRSYDSGSDSSAEDKKTSKMHEREVKELEDPVQKLMQKRETLLKRARSLTEQKDLMMNQREDIISNHKGDKSSLSNLLQENWFLVKEMGNQITKINHMVIEVEKEVEVLKPGNQPLPRAESPQRRRSRSPPAMRFSGPSRQYEHGKTPERNYKHAEASYRNESKGYEYPEHRRSVSPASGKHRSRSPAAAAPHRISSPAARQQRSRSPNVSRHKSRSPNAGRHRTRSPVSGGQQQRLWSPSGEYSKEFQRAPSTSRKRTTTGKPDGEKRQQDMYRKKEEAKEEIDEGLQYPQGFVQRTYIRYCDQGMHWCKLCSIFCESIPEYVDHLLSSSHLAKCKYDRKTWLAKAPKEEKEPKPPNATALIVPVQGVEFLHSLTSYYCSLCDVFMRDKGEAVRHPESKIHTSNYKMHLVKNPMYEASLVKTKAAAYAKYSVEQARYMVEAKMKLKEKIATDEIEEKLLRQIKQKRDMVRQEKEESAEINEKVEKERSQRQESKKEKSEKREREKKVVESDSGKTLDHKNESSVTQTQASESKEYKDTSTRSESKKEKGSSREVVTKDLKTEGDEAAFADGSYKDSQDDEKKSATPKLPLIGKMPFLKKKQQSSVPKRKESSKETKQDIAASSNLVLDSKMEIPLIEEEQKIDLSDNIAWLMGQENENLIENVADPKTIAENEYPVVGDMDACPLASDYTGYEEQSGEVTNQDEEEYSCLDDLNTSECMDIEDDEPTECAAAATLKALDLLSIPLPGFKSANKTPQPSDIPLPPKTDEASRNQDNCDLPLPPGEESYPVTHFEMDNDSQEMLAAANVIHDVHRDCGSGSNSQDSFPMVGLVTNQGVSDMPVPPGTENVVSSDLQVPLLTAEVGSDLPLPPGTESMMGPSLPLPPGTENIISPDVPLPPGTEHVMDPGLPLPPGTEDVGVPCLTLPPGAEDPLSSDLPLPPGTEDVAIASLPLPPGTEDALTSDLPLPPGTEDEAHMLVGSGLGVSSTKSKTVHLQDIAQKSKLGSDMTIPGTHFGAQELSSGAWSSGSNSQDGFGLPAFMTGMHENPIPPPPGTEDEHDLHASMNVLPPLGIRDNIASQFATEKALTASQTTTVCMSSFTAPKLGLHTQNPLWNTSSNPEGMEHTGTTWPTDPSAVMDMPTVARKSHIDREFTPPPPGTEMDDLNKSDSHPELGEASMELSDESDDECLQDKKESTPPPPGTESSSESMAIGESKSSKSIISTLELTTRLDTKIRDPSLSVDFNAQSLDTQVSLPQSKKEESIKSTENMADSPNLSNVNVSKIGKRSCSTEDKEREEKKFSEKTKVSKAKDKVDDERMQTEGNMSKEQGPPQQSHKAPRIGKPSKKESEEVEHGKEGRQESESKAKQRKTSRRSRDSTEEPQYLQPVEEEREFPGNTEVKSSTPKKSTRTGKTEKSEEEEIELEAKINEESSMKHRKSSKKSKERRESVDDLKLAADTDASASQEETQTMKKSSRSGRSTKKDKEENDQDVPVKETKQRKRSTRSSSDDQPSEKGSSTPRRKSRSVRAAIPEEREEDFESVLSPQEMNENAEESEKANSSDVDDEQETDSETVPHQRTRAVRRLVSEDQTYEALSPRKRSRKSKSSVSEEEEPPPRRSTRTTRASITE